MSSPEKEIRLRLKQARRDARKNLQSICGERFTLHAQKFWPLKEKRDG